MAYHSNGSRDHWPQDTDQHGHGAAAAEADAEEVPWMYPASATLPFDFDAFGLWMAMVWEAHVWQSMSMSGLFSGNVLRGGDGVAGCALDVHGWVSIVGAIASTLAGHVGRSLGYALRMWLRTRRRGGIWNLYKKSCREGESSD